ncbi:hypothetical protein BREVUG8_10238 [Brevundimonas sp. G8]|nr:hypothetical protein BREVUG8_10238 [Brevundimonas sp. G8]
MLGQYCFVGEGLRSKACKNGGLYSRVAPRVGFEPTTSRLTVGCSTTELPRNMLGRRAYSSACSDLAMGN